VGDLGRSCQISFNPFTADCFFHQNCHTTDIRYSNLTLSTLVTFKTLKTSLLSKKNIRLPDSSSSNKHKPTSNTKKQEEMQHIFLQQILFFV
jgi:hypothetical protein